MRRYLLWVLLCASVSAVALWPIGAPAQTRDAAAPTTAPAAPPELGETARDLLQRLQEAETRNGFHRVGYDDAGRVRTLFLSAAMASDDNVRAAASLTDLNLIRIRCSYNGVSADALGELRRLDHLEKVDLQSSRAIGLTYGMALAKISSLRAITFTYSDIDHPALVLLAALPHLTTLEFKCCRDLTDGDLTALTQLRQLENLDLSYTTVTPASLDMLATLPRLKRLVITGTGITVDDVKHSKLPGKVMVKGAKPMPPDPDTF